MGRPRGVSLLCTDLKGQSRLQRPLFLEIQLRPRQTDVCGADCLREPSEERVGRRGSLKTSLSRCFLLEHWKALEPFLFPRGLLAAGRGETPCGFPPGKSGRTALAEKAGRLGPLQTSLSPGDGSERGFHSSCKTTV